MDKSPRKLKARERSTMRELRLLKRAIDDFLPYEADVPWVFAMARMEEPPNTSELFQYLKELSQRINAYLEVKESK